MLLELLQVENGLSAWEIDFLDNLNSEWNGDFTDRQAAVIEKIYERVM